MTNNIHKSIEQYEEKEIVKDIYLTYDITGNSHADFKTIMIKDYDYSDSWQYNGRTYNLPNSCLYREGTTPREATRDAKNAVQRINNSLSKKEKITFKHLIAIKFSKNKSYWDGKQGEPHANQ